MGNKDDENEHQTVDEKEAINLADSLGGIFQKVSSKSEYGIEDLFSKIVQK